VKFNCSLIPEDSSLHKYLEALSITEVPFSYVATTSMVALGVLLKRNAWIDQVEWKVYPNLSVLLVGPTGIGKDVAIRAASEVVGTMDQGLLLGGKTMEAIVQQLVDAGDPACALIEAPEMTAFFGGRDYQKSMVQDLTDILSTGNAVNVSLKSEGKRHIKRPTVSMLAGSTEDWLHKAMPDGSLEGGFFPRFVIICEEYGRKFVPLLKHSVEKGEVAGARKAKEQFMEELHAIVMSYAEHPREVNFTREAIDYYENWYINRFKYFGPTVIGYANRSRDQVLRIGMLSAISAHRNYVTEKDLKFAKHVIDYVASTVERAAMPPSKDAQVAKAIQDILPADTKEIMSILSRKYNRNEITAGLQLLQDSGKVIPPSRAGRWERSDGGNTDDSNGSGVDASKG
jgi:hypothetical protein